MGNFLANDYECVQTGSGPSDIKLIPLKPIRTHDGVRVRGDSLPLFKPGDAVRLASARERGTGTRDDILSGPEKSPKRISRGLIWDGSMKPPLHDTFLDAVTELGKGCFVPGRILHAQDLDGVISLGRQWIGGLEAIQSMAKQIEGATLPGFKPKNLIATTFTPPTGDEAIDQPPLTESTKDSLFGNARTERYADSLKKGRQTQDTIAPARVNSAATYAENLAAGRKKMRG
jgi:hypothetical protein